MIWDAQGGSSNGALPALLALLQVRREGAGLELGMYLL